MSAPACPGPAGSGGPDRGDELGLTWREGGGADAERILALFNRAFARVDPSFRPRDLAHWRWRYLHNPDGARTLLALDARGAVEAQYAGSGQVFVGPAGERVRASQSIDSMVAPERRGLAHQGLFVATGVRFAERFGGAREDRDAFMWGLPVRPALRIGRARLGYQVLGNLPRLTCAGGRLAILANAAPAAAYGVAVEEVQRFPAEVTGLFERARGARWLALRDEARLNWRYAERPDARYELALARRGDDLQGWAVARAGSFDGQHATLLVDGLCASGADAARAALLAWAARAALRAGLPLVTVARPEPFGTPAEASDFLALQRAGFEVEPSRLVLVARTFARHPDLETLRAGLWITLGDTDLA